MALSDPDAVILAVILHVGFIAADDVYHVVPSRKAPGTIS